MGFRKVKLISGGIISPLCIAGWLAGCWVTSAASQSNAIALGAEDSSDIPVHLLAIYIEMISNSEMEIHITVENRASLSIQSVRVSIPGGYVQFSRHIKPGQSAEASLRAPVTDEVRELADRNQLGSWKARVMGLEWADEEGQPLHLNVAIQANPFLGLRASFIGADYFPAEPDAELAKPSNVVGYARALVRIQNVSSRKVLNMLYRLEGSANAKWQDIPDGEQDRWSAGLGLAPGAVEFPQIRVPVDIREGKLLKHFDKFRITIDGTTAVQVFVPSRVPSSAPNAKPADPGGVVNSAGAGDAGANPPVDKIPTLLSSPRASYTAEALADGVEGVVKLRALVGTTGAVEKVWVVSDLPYGLDLEAIAATQRSTFSPALKDGKPVPYLLNVEVQFRLQ